jgi:dephospho-CoA kinase
MATKSHAVSSPSESHGFTVGLTGGIGSGKSAVAELFAELGAAIVDTDAIAHALTAPHGAAIEAIARDFGDQYIGADGALDRARVRELIFADPSAKARLEAILHPRIRELAAEQAAAAFEHAPYVILVVPLLVESGSWQRRVSRVLVVDCPEPTQVARVRLRSRLDESTVRAIISQQASRAERLAAADDILVNDGGLEQLVPRVARLHRRYCELAHEAGHCL